MTKFCVFTVAVFSMMMFLCQDVVVATEHPNIWQGVEDIHQHSQGLAASSIKPRMPQSEWNVGGVGRGCTLGYVKSVYGEPQEKKIINISNDGSFRNVTYIYSPTFKIWGVGTKAEEDLKIFGFECTDSTLQTPSGFHVGMPYTAVTKKYQSGNKIERKGRTYYQHDCLYFYVDRQEIITEIELRQDI